MRPGEQHMEQDPAVEAGVSLTAGAVTTALWCPTCKAFTVLDGEIWLLARGGLVKVGGWRWCEVCDDPAEPPIERRTGRGQ
ncbi:hypothetical protein [Kitasatospora sp. NPDC058046]|uniref:hypothetical protein n=1 Tax=Kitasatospora sp. NPDC058046 TaxID=3346312 RepID=UPI0036DEDBBB